MTGGGFKWVGMCECVCGGGHLFSLGKFLIKFQTRYQ